MEILVLTERILFVPT